MLLSCLVLRVLSCNVVCIARRVLQAYVSVSDEEERPAIQPWRAGVNDNVVKPVTRS